MQFRLTKILFGFAEIAMGIWLVFGLKVKFDAKALNTTSTLIFWPAVALIVLGGSSLIEFLKNKKLPILKVNILIFFVLIFIGEIALRYFMFYSTYFEKNKQEPYVSVYEEPTFDSLGFHRPPNSEFNYYNGEFEYQRKCNDWGYTNRDLPAAKPKNEIWYFVFGDSFCEGAGVGFENAVPSKLESYFKGFDDTISVRFYNFGMSGSDDVFLYFLWENHLRHRKPNGLIFLQNTTDIQDIKIRGGLERFKENYKLSYREPPNWEWLYASSHFLRAFFHRVFQFDFSLIPNSQNEELELRSIEIMTDVFNSIRNDESNTIVFTYPQLEEYKKGYYTYPHFATWADSSNYIIDLSASFFKLKDTIAYEEIYWPMDRHFNENGYTILSNLIAKELEPELKRIIEKRKKSLTLELQTSN